MIVDNRLYDRGKDVLTVHMAVSYFFTKMFWSIYAYILREIFLFPASINNSRRSLFVKHKPSPALASSAQVPPYRDSS